MAQNIEIANAQYNDVPSIEVPKQGGGTASFVDTTDADAIASEIDMGKTAYVNGVKLTGTRSGGGSYTAGDGIDITNDVISLDVASANDIGGIKVGSGLSIDANGVLSAIGGGGGGSGLSFTLLWENDSGWNSGQITLNYSWKNYDVLFFVTARPSESPTSSNPYVTQNFLLTYYIKINPVKHLLYNYDNRYLSFSFTNDTTFTAGNGNDLNVYKIYGINIG